jgi:hypothetical protein
MPEPVRPRVGAGWLAWAEYERARQEWERELATRIDRYQNAWIGRNVVAQAAVLADANAPVGGAVPVPIQEGNPREIFRAVPRARAVPEQPPTPVQEAEMPETLANPFLIGCDPEFVILDGPKKALNAQNLGIGHAGEIGYDHNGVVIEVRPQPGKGTYTLLQRIKRALNSNANLKKATEKHWRSGALVELNQADPLRLNAAGVRQGNPPVRKLTLGGHVHLDIPPLGYAGVDEDTFHKRLNAMDRVTKYMEHFDILPKAESAVRREEGAKMPQGSRYGQWGDWRTAGEGRIRMEYRTPASWLYCPKAAYLVLTGIKLAATSPQLVIDTLKVKTISEANFRRFFELYRHKDANARRLLEKLLDGKTLKSLVTDPDTDVRKAWEKELSF